MLSAFVGPQFSQVVDETLDDPGLRDILTTLVGVAFAGYIRLADNDLQKATELIDRERQAAEDLRDL
ncbi:hypothetical protein L841_0082 [Mycobacterium sp. MAC_080597_8934]|nr:hypothetical protein L841_0082 [Mycobacterium sp. MAC_080597_8934]